MRERRHRVAAANPAVTPRRSDGGRHAPFREVAFVRRVCLRLVLGRRARAQRDRLLPQAAVRGPLHAGARFAAARQVRCGAARAHRRGSGARKDSSSLHVLFPRDEEARLLEQHGMLLRRTVQFHWRNDEYADFEGFLARLSHARRKNIRQERRKLRAAA